MSDSTQEGSQMDEARFAVIKDQILKALAHPEAEEGLYFRNLHHHHEEDERVLVEGSQEEILEALRELISDERVRADETGEEVIFFLVN